MNEDIHNYMMEKVTGRRYMHGGKKGGSEYFAVVKQAGQKKSKRISDIKPSRNATEIRNLVIGWLHAMGDVKGTIVTVYARRDLGFVDPYEFICVTSQGIERCFQNRLTEKAAFGDKGALRIMKLLEKGASHESWQQDLKTRLQNMKEWILKRREEKKQRKESQNESR